MSTTQPNDPAKKKRSDNLLLRTLHGRLLSTDFFKRHWFPVATILVMFIIYITNRYQCLTRMETIQRLEHELEVVQTERVLQQSTYMSRTRESAMRELVDSMKLGLAVQERPPYNIDYAQ